MIALTLTKALSQRLFYFIFALILHKALPKWAFFSIFAIILTKALPKSCFSFCALILTKTLPKRVFFSVSPSYGVYISQLIRFATVCSNVDDFNNRNLFLTAKLLKQGYRYHKIRKAFSKFYHRHSELTVKLG